MTPPRARLLLALGAALVALAAGAPSALASSYCSPTGDYCVVAKPAGERDRLLQVAGFPFRGRYRLCVYPPRGARTCRTFPLRRGDGDMYSSSVRWSLHFPNRGHGVYRVRWTVSTDEDERPTTRLRGLAFRR